MANVTKLKAGMMTWVLEALFRRTRPLPPVKIVCTFNHHRSLVTPNPTVSGEVLNTSGDHVVHIAFGLSPTHDCLYVFDIAVRPGFQGRGYALASVNALWHRFRLPVRPVHITMMGEGFWTPGRFKRLGIRMVSDISTTQMGEEKERWAHLAPWDEILSETIRRRLFDEQVPYGEAVRVGIDFPGRKVTETDDVIRSPNFTAA